VSKVTIENIERLAHALARPGGDLRLAPPANYIFWLGAGFSKTAGIPLAEEVVDRLLDKRWRPTVDGGAKLQPFSQLSEKDKSSRQTAVRDWAIQQQVLGSNLITDWAATYGECLRLLPGEVDRQEFIIDCIQEGRGRLNMAHLLLGQLLKNSFINTVLTTNFDDLVLRALQLYFVVPAALDPDSTNTLLTNSKFVQVAYLHGRLASYRQRHTLSEVQGSIPGFENYLTQALQDHGLVIIGYRGGDETPIHLLHKVLLERGTGPGRGLFWITRTDAVESLPQKVREILNLKDCYWVPGWDADEFMRKLCAWPGIGLGIPNPSEWIKGMEEILPDEARKLLNNDAAGEKTIELRTDGDAGARPRTKVDSSAPQWIKKAERLVAEGHGDQALKVLRGAKPRSEQSPKGLSLWTRAFHLAGKHEEALTAAQKFVKLAPADPYGHLLLGHALGAERRHEEATSAYRRAIELGATGVQPYVGLGMSLNFLHRPEDSLKVFEQGAENAADDEDRSIALSWLAISLNDLGKHEEAIERFNEAAKFAPLDGASHFFWSKSLEALGRGDEAAEKFKRYQELTNTTEKVR